MRLSLRQWAMVAVAMAFLAYTIPVSLSEMLGYDHDHGGGH